MKVKPKIKNPSEFTVGRSFKNVQQLRQWIHNPNAYHTGRLETRAGVFAK